LERPNIFQRNQRRGCWAAQFVPLIRKILQQFIYGCIHVKSPGRFGDHVQI
jgi:hypothetical protein